MLEHAVLMNSRLVCEGIFSDDGLIPRDRHAGNAGHQPRGRVQALRVDVRFGIEERFARPQGHDDFFERAIARAFADTVDRALDLSSARDHRRQAVGDRHPEIVVTVD